MHQMTRSCGVVLLCVLGAGIPIADGQEFRRGDTNLNGTLDLGDPISTLNHLFLGGPANCLSSADANDDESVDLADAFTVLEYLFAGGSSLPPPFPDCGLDPTVGVLTCIDTGLCPAFFDASFNPQMGGFAGVVRAIAPAKDGSGDVYVGGTFSSVTRLNSDGTVDGGFDIGTGFAGGPFPIVNAIAPATDGSGDIYVGGLFSSYNGTASNNIIRLNSDGTIDVGFVVGTGFTGAPSGVVVVMTITPATDGSGDIYVGGLFTNYNGTFRSRIIRLNSDGTVDTGFVGGVSGGGISAVIEIAPATDGSGDFFVGGQFSNYSGTPSRDIVRLNSDGTIDAGFIVGTGFDDIVNSIAPATDGSGDVYVGGWFTSYDGTGSNSINRLNSDGTVDAGFVVGTGFNTFVNEIAPATDGSGDVYVGGVFTSYDGTGSNRIIRLNSDGTADAGFVVGTGFSDSVNAIALATDGSGDIYVGGNFGIYDGTGSYCQMLCFTE